MGVGPDGHTASLFPRAPALAERERRAVAAEAGMEPFVPRVTTTIPFLAQTELMLFVVTGADKADAVRRAFAEEPPTTPRKPRARAAHGAPARPRRRLRVASIAANPYIERVAAAPSSLTIGRPDQLKALGHPLRLRVLEVLGESGEQLTNRQLAQRLGVDPGHLHFHVRMLLGAGLIELVEGQGRRRSRTARSRPASASLPS